jgi:hypothetical protein
MSALDILLRVGFVIFGIGIVAWPLFKTLKNNRANPVRFGEISLDLSPDPIKVFLPMPSERANARKHYMAAAKEKRDYFDACNLFLMETHQTVPHQLVFVRYNVHLETGRAMDFDNLVARTKWPIDFLVERGFLVNDDPKHFWPYQLPTQEIIYKKNIQRFIYFSFWEVDGIWDSIMVEES